MGETHERGASPWPILAGLFALGYAAAIVYGVHVRGAPEEAYGNAVSMPVAATVIAALLGASGIGLLCRNNLARYLFLIVAPPAALAIGSAFPEELWTDDIPHSAAALFVYAPLAFLLSRGGSLRALGARSGGFIARGALVLLICLVVAGSMRLTMKKPGRRRGFGAQLMSMNEYVQRLVIAEVPLYHYGPAFVLCLIPTRFRRRKSDAEPA